MTHRNFEATLEHSGCDFPPLAVSVRSDGPSALLVEVRGELDLATAPILKQQLESYNDPSRNSGHPPSIVYLLPELKFMDSTGLHSLLTAVDGHGPETITVREPSTHVRRLLELVGLDSMIEEGANR
ncbi:MAG TPA: STAS domain-containing protein [Acidimicrobiia bacterium]|nr:STAS domain-containing protein [Acidimicrobiia bacterium]